MDPTERERLLATCRVAFDYTVTQLEPDFSQLQEALGADPPLDAGSFSMGMLAAAWVLQGMDLLETTREFGPLFRDFVANCRREATT